MISSYLSNMQIRLAMIDSCIGGVQAYKQDKIKQIKSMTIQYISKLHKDTQRRFEKIKKIIQKYHDVLDTTSFKQKIVILSDEIQELKEIETQLQNIEKNLPALNTQKYTQIRDKFNNIDYLLTGSQVQLTETNDLTVKIFDDQSLYEIRNQHREQMNQLLELNKRIVNNLNNKLQLLMRKAAKSAN